MQIRRCTLTVLGWLLALPAMAADEATLERGRLLAEQMCGRCHATAATGASPHKITPPFRDLPERFPVEMLVEAQRSGEISGHDEMPMFVIAPEDMTALLAHIDSFAGPKSRYLGGAAK
ncbi:MAG: cytochrome c [Hyphomicrobiaceae bacterium]